MWLKHYFTFQVTFLVLFEFFVFFSEYIQHVVSKLFRSIGFTRATLLFSLSLFSLSSLSFSLERFIEKDFAQFINCAEKRTSMLLKMIIEYFISYSTGRNTYQSFHGNNTQYHVSQLVCAL